MSEEVKDTIIGKMDLGRIYLEMDSSGGGNLQEKSVTITTNTLTEVEPDEGYDGLSKVNVTTNIPSPTLEEKNVTILENGESEIEPSEGYDAISKVNLVVDVPTGTDYSKYGYNNGIPLINEQTPIMDTIQTNWDSSQTSGYRAFYDRGDIIIFPYIDTSNITNAREFFAESSRLVQIPKLDFSNVTNNNHYHMFSSCYYLDRDSVNTILLMCSEMSLITSNKTLSYMGVSVTNPYIGDITTYSNYQAFINAGWTIN